MKVKSEEANAIRRWIRAGSFFIRRFARVLLVVVMGDGTQDRNRCVC
jgi:hypothetical protein